MTARSISRARKASPSLAHDFEHDLATVALMAQVPLVLDVVCRTTGMGYAAIARVTPGRWVCLAARDLIGFGLGPGGELEVETTICHEIRRDETPVVIDNVAEDPVYRNHHTPAKYGLQSYISVPIFLRDGSFYGTLCAIDPKPAKLKESTALDLFKLLADLIGAQLDVSERAMRAEASLLDAQQAVELREQFVAVLGHDLRNPLNSIAIGTSLLEPMQTDERAKTMVTRMGRSVDRMKTLIDEVMDFARGRLGGGIEVDRSPDSLAPTLRHVVDELRAAFPDRTIEATFDIAVPVTVDRQRIGQLLSNLLANALSHDKTNAAVRVIAKTTGPIFELSVTNGGPAIPAEIRKRLFAPFARGADRAANEGLGLGLYIVAEIARAHEGTIDVESTDGTTTFTFRMPIGPASAGIEARPTRQ